MRQFSFFYYLVNFIFELIFRLVMFSKLYIWLHKKGDVILKPIVELLIKLKISPNLLTLFSLMFVLLSFKYLFVNYFLFVLFSLSHLLMDILDGLVARKTKKETKFGYYFDYLVDRLYPVLMVFKFGNYTVLLILLLYQVLNLINRKHLYFRTGLMIGFILTLYSLTVKVLLISVLIGIFYQMIIILLYLLRRFKNELF